MSIKKRIQSFGFAFQGIKTLFEEEPNAIIHLAAALFAIALAFYFNISTIEWIIVILCIAAVFAAEMINTAVENLADAITLEIHPKIKKAKDVAAAAVLVLAIGAAIVGVIVFWPYLTELLT